MNYTEKTKPGMGDPYWYEWSVGEQQIINMLNEDNNIEFVELQANVGLGLDDVVVTYSDGRVLCIQVKHTRADDTLTFADLVYSEKKTSKSLLAELADSWQEESSKYTEVIPQIFTNRRKGKVSSSTKGDNKFVRPALDEFWTKLNEKIKKIAPTLSRGVLEKKGPGVNGKYNQDFNKNTILIEVGGQYNYIEEVNNTLKIISKVIYEYLEDEKEN